MKYRIFVLLLISSFLMIVLSSGAMSAYEAGAMIQSGASPVCGGITYNIAEDSCVNSPRYLKLSSSTGYSNNYRQINWCGGRYYCCETDNSLHFTVYNLYPKLTEYTLSGNTLSTTGRSADYGLSLFCPDPPPPECTSGDCCDNGAFKPSGTICETRSCKSQNYYAITNGGTQCVYVNYQDQTSSCLGDSKDCRPAPSCSSPSYDPRGSSGDCSRVQACGSSGIGYSFITSNDATTPDTYQRRGVNDDQTVSECVHSDYYCSGSDINQRQRNVVQKTCGIHQYVRTCTESVQDCGDFYTINNLNADALVSNENLRNRYQLGQQTVEIEKDGIKVADLTVNFNSNHDWSDVTVLVDESSSLIHVPTNHIEVADEKTLYVPAVSNTGTVIICPGASSFSEINPYCANKQTVTDLVPVNGYYEVQVTGSGAMEVGDNNLEDCSIIESDIIPTMTSDNAPSGFVTYSSNAYGQSPGWYAFDNVETTASSWYGSLNQDNQWVQYDFGIGERRRASGAKIVRKNSVDGTKDFNIQGSLDGINWNNIYSGTFALSEFTKELDLRATSDYFRFYRFTVTSHYGNSYGNWYDDFSEIELYEDSCVETYVPTCVVNKVDVVPTMTSDNAPSGAVTYSSNAYGSYPGWYAFDGIVSNARSWYGSLNQDNQWVQYDFGINNEKDILGFRIQRKNSGDGTKGFTITASNDGSTWDSLYTGEFGLYEFLKEIDATDAQAYRFYRFTVTSHYGNGYGNWYDDFSEIEMWEGVCGGVASCDDNTLVMIQSDTTDGDTIFENLVSDEVVNGYGNVRHSTTEKAIGTSSIYFDGTGSYLETDISGILNDGDDFTIDFWAYRDTDYRGGRRYLFDTRDIGPSTNFLYDDGSVALGFASGDIALSSAGMSERAWHHIAITKSGSIARMFVDGSLVATDSSANSVAADIESIFKKIGTYSTGNSGYNWIGYIDELRLSNIARWTAPFTPSAVHSCEGNENPGLRCTSNFYCDAGEYCQKDNCADTLGDCMALPDGVDPVIDPVCGCNNVTYNNALAASSSGVNVDYTGTCYSSCIEEGGFVRKGYSYTDECTADVLTENYCLNGEPQSTTTTCLNGCSNGACEETIFECAESDRGANYYVAGTTVSYDGVNVNVESDYCVNGDTLFPLGPTSCCTGLDLESCGDDCEESITGTCTSPVVDNCATEGENTYSNTPNTPIYDPVCGCDGTVYTNSTFAGVSGQNIDYIGECNLDTGDDSGDTGTNLPDSYACTSDPLGVFGTEEYNGNYLTSHAFDGSVTTATYVDEWLSGNINTFPDAHVGYDFRVPVIVSEYAITSMSYGGNYVHNPKSWVVEGSDDFSNWDILDTRNDVSTWSISGERRAYIIPNPANYRYYRLRITDTSTHDYVYVGVSELEFNVVGGCPNPSQYATKLDSSNSSGVFGTEEYNGNYLSSHAFDGSVTTATYVDDWLSENINTYPETHVGYDFRVPVTVSEYAITSMTYGGNYVHNPKSWVLEGSNDRSSWNILDTRNDVSRWSYYGEKRAYIISNPVNYRYYRLRVTDTSTHDRVNVGFSELEFYTTGDSPDPSQYPIKIDTSNLLSVFGTQEYGTSYASSHAFDGSVTTATYVDEWLSGNINTFTDTHVGYDFGISTNVSEYAITSMSYSSNYIYNPMSWVVEGSDDHSSWNILDTRNDVSKWSYYGERRAYIIQNPANYRYYRLRVTDTSTHGQVYVGVSELEFFNSTKRITEYGCADNTECSDTEYCYKYACGDLGGECVLKPVISSDPLLETTCCAGLTFEGCGDSCVGDVTGICLAQDDCAAEGENVYEAIIPGPDSNILMEYYCNEDHELDPVIFDCGDDGCANGECITFECGGIGETVYFTEGLNRPIKCCNENATIKPALSFNSNHVIEGSYSCNGDTPHASIKGECSLTWDETCGDGTCSFYEDRCNCFEDCGEPLSPNFCLDDYEFVVDLWPGTDPIDGNLTQGTELYNQIFDEYNCQLNPSESRLLNACPNGTYMAAEYNKFNYTCYIEEGETMPANVACLNLTYILNVNANNFTCGLGDADYINPISGFSTSYCGESGALVIGGNLNEYNCIFLSSYARGICADPDGVNIGVKSSTSISKAGDLLQEEIDSCYQEDGDSQVTEHSCIRHSVWDDDEINSAIYDCPINNECNDGVCINPNAEDFDFRMEAVELENGQSIDLDEDLDPYRFNITFFIDGTLSFNETDLATTRNGNEDMDVGYYITLMNGTEQLVPVSLDREKYNGIKNGAMATAIIEIDKAYFEEINFNYPLTFEFDPYHAIEERNELNNYVTFPNTQDCVWDLDIVYSPDLECCNPDSGIKPLRYIDEDLICTQGIGYGMCIPGWDQSCGNGVCSYSIGEPEGYSSEDSCNCVEDCGGMSCFEESHCDDGDVCTSQTCDTDSGACIFTEDCDSLDPIVSLVNPDNEFSWYAGRPLDYVYVVLDSQNDNTPSGNLDRCMLGLDGPGPDANFIYTDVDQSLVTNMFADVRIEVDNTFTWAISCVDYRGNIGNSEEREITFEECVNDIQCGDDYGCNNEGICKPNCVSDSECGSTEKCINNLCEYACGDGIVDTWNNEECDDNNNDDGDDCDSSCQFEAYCGNNVIDHPDAVGIYEECDGASMDGFTCENIVDILDTCDVTECNRTECTAGCEVEIYYNYGITEYCGDESLSGCELCDGDLIQPGLNCSAFGYDSEILIATCDLCMPDLIVCQSAPELCGNGFLEENENCDDYNLIDGDGCSSICEFELTCGDGIIQMPNGNNFNETCDSNNLNDETCSSLGYPDRTLSCNSNCTYNITDCGAVPCVDTSDCNDGSDCTSEICSAGLCEFTLIEPCVIEPNCTDASAGMTLCLDGSCSYQCNETDEDVNTTCNFNGTCDATESCACVDCDGDKNICNDGLICSSVTGNCACEAGLTLCIDGSCSYNCPVTDTGNSTICNNDTTCDTNEGCACSDCDGEQSVCASGSVCSNESNSCVCEIGANRCSDGTCSDDCNETDGGPDITCNNDLTCDANESCACGDCDGETSICSGGSVCSDLTDNCVCPAGTQELNGVCLDEACTDSDGGLDYYNFGYTSIYIGEINIPEINNDTCLTDDVMEEYCLGTSGASLSKTCAFGCDEGSCVMDETGCNNGIQDNDETDVDCGGNCLQRCGPLDECIVDSDCVGGNCVNGLCDDPIANQTYELDIGWNLISIPMEPLDEDINVIFADLINVSVERVLNYENRIWMANNFGLAPSNLNIIEKGKAYWVKMNETDNLTVRGVLYNEALDLDEEWNFIGIASLVELTAEEYFGNDYKSIDEIHHFAINATGDKNLERIGFGNVSAVILEPGVGYWVNIPQ